MDEGVKVPASRGNSTEAIRPVSIDDEVFATGKLVSGGGTMRLEAVGRGLYDQGLQKVRDHEASIGLDAWPRVAMRRSLRG